MNRRRPKIIVVTGPNGSGKTRLCAHLQCSLVELYGPESVVTASIWDGLQYNNRVVEKSAAVNFVSTLKGTTRTLFLFHCMSLAMDMAQELDPGFIIVNGFWYYLAAAELARQVPKKAIFAAAQGFDPPDAAFFLNASPFPETLRMSAYRITEDRFSDRGGLATPTRNSEFSKQTGEIWHNIEATFGPWIHLDAADSVCVQGAKVLDSIIPKKRFPGQPHEPLLRH